MQTLEDAIYAAPPHGAISARSSGRLARAWTFPRFPLSRHQRKNGGDVNIYPSENGQGFVSGGVQFTTERLAIGTNE